MGEVLVSIRCLVYNHGAYLKTCLDGFVTQQTNFKFEAIIHDDCSTDNSRDIINEYAIKYPNIIKPIYESENMYSKRRFDIINSKIYNQTRGKYIAICEGDDYWTDPYKLQKQVDFLESHPDYVMCSHDFNAYFQQNKILENNEGRFSSKIHYELNNLIKGEWYFQPLTVMYRQDMYSFEEYRKYPVSIDATLFYYLLTKGKGCFLPDVMAVYRIHNGGVWSKVGLDRQRLMEYKTRLGIYEVEKSKEAATFLLTQFTKPMSRKWMLKQYKMMFDTFNILSNNFGYHFTLKIFINKLIFGRIYNA